MSSPDDGRVIQLAISSSNSDPLMGLYQEKAGLGDPCLGWTS